MKRIITLILSLLLLVTSFSMFACDGNGGGGGSSASTKPKSDVTFAATEIDLVTNGTTQYSIVVPANIPKFVQFAADELKALFFKSTGIMLNVVTENSQMTTEGYYLSLGYTILREQAEVEPPMTGVKNPFFIWQSDVQILGERGAFSIKRVDNTVIMVGIDDYGTVFAAYEFLKKQLGYEYYAADEIKIDTVANEKLLDFDWSYTPSYMNNQATNRMATEEAALRYGMIRSDREMYYPHSWLTVLPYGTYGADHPDWYGANGQALCISNAEMAKQYAKNVLDKMLETGYATHMAGQSDSWAKCSCSKCQVNDGKYMASGTNVIFINRVCNEIDRLLAEMGMPDFRYRIVMLAYYQYEAPPVVVDQQGNYLPISDEVIFHPNAGVNHCLFGSADAARGLTEQPGAVAQCEGWLACQPDVYEMYIYRGYFPLLNLAFPFDWANLKDWLVTAKGYGSMYNVWSIPGYSQFNAMRAYLHGQLCYDLTQNPNDLMSEFIRAFYKDAAPYVQQFFDEVTSYCYMMNEANPAFGLPTLSGSAGHLLEKKANWPEEMLTDWVQVFEQAYAAIAQNTDYTPTQRDVLEVRIDDEALWPQYWLLKFYGKTHYTTEEYAALRKQVLDDAYRAGYTEDQVGGSRLPE